MLSLIRKRLFFCFCANYRKKPGALIDFRLRPISTRVFLKGFTLVEILVVTVIFSLIILGMLSVFDAGNRHVIHTRERITSSELGKLFIDRLQLGVNWSTWGLSAASNALVLGTTYCDGVGGHTQNIFCPPAAQRTINNRTFSATYVTTAIADSTASDANDNLRRVTTTINWTEPSP